MDLPHKSNITFWDINTIPLFRNSLKNSCPEPLNKNLKPWGKVDVNVKHIKEFQESEDRGKDLSRIDDPALYECEHTEKKNESNHESCGKLAVENVTIDPRDFQTFRVHAYHCKSSRYFGG